jgi:hypothetical protein
MHLQDGVCMLVTTNMTTVSLPRSQYKFERFFTVLKQSQVLTYVSSIIPVVEVC